MRIGQWLLTFLMAGVMVAIPHAASARQYDPYLEILEGSVICRQGLLGLGSGPLLEYNAWLTDPNGNVVGNQDEWTYSWRLDGQYSVEPSISGTYTCYARFYVNGQYIGQLQQSKNITAPTPTSLNKYYEAYKSGLPPGCSSARYWKVRDYRVMDQNNQPIERQMFMDESFTTSQNTCNVSFVEGDGQTTSLGTFRDNFFMCGSVPACNNGGSCIVQRSQSWKADGHSVGQYSLTYTCNGVTITP